jgi:alpha-ribazole phosphatase
MTGEDEAKTAATRLILVRHGQTTCNIEDIWHGWDDCELTPLGLSQAEAVAERLADEPLSAVYSSDSRRALQTAAAIARRHRLKPVSMAGLRERNAGEYEGLRAEEIVARNPRIWAERDADFWNWSPPGGETFYQLLDRAMRAITEIRERHAGQTVVAVSHMATTRALISHLAGIPILDTFKLEFPSTGVSIFRLSPGATEVETLNDGAHLVV